MLRDLVLTCFVIACLYLTFRNPFAGVLSWAWIALMQPHREAYGVITSTLRVNFLVALIATLAWLFSKEQKKPVVDATFVTVVLFFVWVTFNCFFAIDPPTSWYHWDDTWRILALALMVSITARTRVRIHALIWIVVISLLYYGTKGGILSLMSGGAKRIEGPSSTIIADNNQLALALLMILPLVAYLYRQSESRLARYGLVITGSLTFLSVMGSYSRGAYIALSALAILGWLRSRNKFLYPILIASIALPAIYFMPEAFWDRLNTFNTLDQDESWNGRLTAWHVAYYVARDHFPFGAGFAGAQTPSVFLSYFPNSTWRAAHSIYFEVLGDHGFVGLALYLLIIFLAFWNTQKLRKLTRKNVEQAWIYNLATMIQLSLLVFCTGGAALSMSYYDVFVIWIALLPVLIRLTKVAYQPITAKESHHLAFASAHHQTSQGPASAGV